MISKLNGPILRTLLWTLLESYVSTELNRRVTKDILIKKDSVLESFENENSMLNERIQALTNSLDRRRKLASPDGQEDDAVNIIKGLEEKIQIVEAKLETCLADKRDLFTDLKELQTALSQAQVLRAQSEERLALLLSQQKLAESTEGTDQMLIKLQEVFKVTGTSSEERESIRQRLENCVEDACSNMLDEATALRDEKIQEVNVQRKTLTSMYAALGLSMDQTVNSTNPNLSLNDQLQLLKHQTSEIQSQYQVAIERRNQLESEAINLTSAIGGDTSDSLQKLMSTNRRSFAANYRASMSRAEMFKDVKNMMKGLQVIDEASEEIYPAQRKDEPKINAAEPGSLSTTFLDSCAQDIKKLRLLKSERQISNATTCDKIRNIIKQMHVSREELSDIVQTQGTTAKALGGHVLRSVYDAIFKRGSVLITTSFTNHLNVVLEIIQVISHKRQLLSDKLAKEIKECHTALITTAKDCGMDVSDMASSLHDGLFHLPPLSKEYIEACIDNMQMLVTAVETLTISEVETLTVLFEGLGLSSKMQQTSEIELTSTSPFDNLRQECSTGVEKWVIKSSSDAARIQKVLCVKVFKLSQIHKEVERLKIKQQSKNGILSLNGELQILSIKLAAFEDRAGDKQRLLNKKANSSSLLKEERFRKQMQSCFKTKLDSLRKMLNDWESKYGGIMEDDPLHEIVKSMLEMSEKTGLMHLRTTNTKSSCINKQWRPSSATRPTSGGGGRSRDASASSTQSSTSTIRRKPTTQTSSRYSSVPPVNRRPTSQNSERPSSIIITGNQSLPEQQQQQRKALSASTHNASRSERETTRPLALKVESVLDPFINIAETPTPKGENQHYF